MEISYHLHMTISAGQLQGWLRCLLSPLPTYTGRMVIAFTTVMVNGVNPACSFLSFSWNHRLSCHHATQLLEVLVLLPVTNVGLKGESWR